MTARTFIDDSSHASLTPGTKKTGQEEEDSDIEALSLDAANVSSVRMSRMTA